MSDDKTEVNEFTDDQAEESEASEVTREEESIDTLLEDSLVDDPLNAESVRDDQDREAEKTEREETTPGLPDLSIIGDIPILLTLEVGDKEMAISEVSSLRVGSVVTLQHKESEPLDVKANGVLIAKGEVVLVGDYYGVRILSLTKNQTSDFKLSP
ncbi:FliM/FliN family flagellar motor switch protein [Parendozoicomonas sp. Alg238-R29]|uniref:FliM/FliN family flagellar motor switch protein n=1 Tax=Parendozoicomonas sp. Alg238-R29 TaxID=2993446 RepID=UPI00248EA423|nr:FliM/FliN family flagellar motor switch protein [Parendozoicomonas sp. Alg238-R29]